MAAKVTFIRKVWRRPAGDITNSSVAEKHETEIGVPPDDFDIYLQRRIVAPPPAGGAEKRAGDAQRPR